MSGGRGRACRFLAHFAPRMPIIGRINTENGAIKNARGEDNLHDSEFYPERVTILINCCSKPYFFFIKAKEAKPEREPSEDRRRKPADKIMSGGKGRACRF